MENQEIENGNIGVWYPKKDGRDFIFNYDPNREMPEGYTVIPPLHGVEYQTFNDSTQKWVPDPAAEQKAQAVAEREQLIAEIAGRDYRALKAVKLGEKLDEIYPGESEWYREKIARVNELEALIGVQ